MTVPDRYRRNVLYFLFAVSGFSGLIYESIWSHYLKLFLGHAAYAQTLVLAIFMGGMAIGAWLASRYSKRSKNLLLWYAIVEGTIGVCALVFHATFVSATDFAYTTVLPNLGSPWTIDLFKWILAGGLILPQSILLGATFPLMSAGLIRRFPAAPGANLAMLYFTNSLGAAIGVLISGFWLIAAVGLPGTILTAGLINIALAIVVWRLVRGTAEKAPPAQARVKRADASGSWRLLLAVSAVTGASSFMYEIGWIRMLNLVLGSSTHAFELMLSAFILGLAFGGLWIRRRIDSLQEPVRFLGLVQVAMGLLALATLVAYNGSFDLMEAMLGAIKRSTGGYFLFTLTNHGIALAIMFPATFCAGMTLPLITLALLRQRNGEQSIGAVYAANTLGAIAGVFFAIHIGLPLMGLKGLIVIGAAFDMALGVVLLYRTPVASRARLVRGAALLTCVAIVATVFGVDLDRYKMASGVYRFGGMRGADTMEILYHKDGKTATVDLTKHPSEGISIRTNGKVDAHIQISPDLPAAADESTMILAAAIPLALHPQARTVANIGLGSGLTTHTFLSVPTLERVDTIEIEPAMVEAARGFGARVKNTFEDSRSHIYIDDAKTFFAAHNSRYDIIVSEPSNPWVSGVAGLFSDEFYRRVRSHLAPRGLFVQWLQLYEIDMRLVASVMKAIDRNFPDYVTYVTNDMDLLIVARSDGSLSRPDPRVLALPDLAREISRINVTGVPDIELRRVGDRALLRPFLLSALVSANSDFFPILDLNAERTRFMQSGAGELPELGIAPLPLLEMLGGDRSSADKAPNVGGSFFKRSERKRAAIAVRETYTRGAYTTGDDAIDTDLAALLVVSLQLDQDCRGARAQEIWFNGVFRIASIVLPQLQSRDARILTRHWKSSDCYRRLSRPRMDWVTLFHAVGQRDATKMATIAEKLLAGENKINEEKRGYLLGAGMLGQLAQHRPEEAQRLWMTYVSSKIPTGLSSLAIQILLAHSLYDGQATSTPPEIDASSRNARSQ